VVIALRGKDGDCEATAVLRAIGPLLPPPPPGAPGPLALGQDGLLERLATEVGLTPGAWVAVECPWVFSNLETALQANPSAGPTNRAINHAGEDIVRAALTEALKPFRLSDGGYRLENKVRSTVATA
jgi:hypothetical protein